MKLTIDVLQCFQKVAELEHVTRAAEALQLAIPASWTKYNTDKIWRGFIASCEQGSG